MGTVYLPEEKEALKYIKSRLKPRGLKVDPEEEWEVHGPHYSMNYQVYIGWAYRPADPNVECRCVPDCQMDYCRAHDQGILVAIYPKRIYEIEDESDWSMADPSTCIPTIKTN